MYLGVSQQQWPTGGCSNASVFSPLGHKQPPFLLDLVSKGFHWILIAELGFRTILHYLDDFLAVFSPGTGPCVFNKQFNWSCDELGLLVNFKKDLWGCILDFPGIEINTIAMVTRLPEDKLRRAIDGTENAFKSQSIRFSTRIPFGPAELCS